MGRQVEFPDTAAVVTVTLPRVVQALGEVHVTVRAKPAANLQGFYDRWTARQQGALSATFIGPEEIEIRNPTKISDMLSGLNGVQLRRMPDGDVVAFGMNNQCVFAIMIDGQRQCPASGCHMNGGGNAPQISGRSNPTFDLVPINQYLDADNVAAIEVYTRGGNMPASLQVSDPGCGSDCVLDGVAAAVTVWDLADVIALTALTCWLIAAARLRSTLQEHPLRRLGFFRFAATSDADVPQNRLVR